MGGPRGGAPVECGGGGRGRLSGRQSVITKYYQVLTRDSRIITGRFNAVGIMARLISELPELTKD